MLDQDPQATPGETGTEVGQSQETEQPTASVGPVVDETTQRLMALEEKNKELQRRLTQQGRELAEQKRAPSANQPSGSPVFWENPEAVLDAKLQAFEQRQEQRRQAEEMLREFAEEKGIPVRELKKLNDELQGAAADPLTYLDTLAKFHQAKNAATAVQTAAESAVKSAQKNARAVTAEGGGTQAIPSSKPEEEMTVDELRAHLVKKYGIENPEGVI